MSGKHLKSLVTVVGVPLLTGVVLVATQTSHAAGPSSSSAPVLLVNPELIVIRAQQPGAPQPDQVNPVPIELVIGIRQTARAGNSVYAGLFQPLDSSSLSIRPLPGSVVFQHDCTPVEGLPLVRCQLNPPEDPPEGPPGFWGQFGLIQFVMDLNTASGDVAESYQQYVINPPPPPPPE